VDEGWDCARAGQLRVDGVRVRRANGRKTRRPIVGDPAPLPRLIVRDASGEIVERARIGWITKIDLGVVRTRGLKIGDQVETVDGRVLVKATAATVGGRR